MPSRWKTYRAVAPWRYAQHDSDVTALALGLLAKGVKADDRVGIWSPDHGREDVK